MKKLLFLIILVNSLFGLGGIASLSKDEKSVALKLKQILALDEANTYRLYKGYFQSYLNSKHWNVYWYDNTDPADNKISNTKNKTAFITILNDDRVINISIVKYPKIKRLFINTIESLPRKSSSVLKKFNKLKTNSKFLKERETNTYAYFKEKGYMSDINIIVRDPAGLIQFFDTAVFKLK